MLLIFMILLLTLTSSAKGIEPTRWVNVGIYKLELFDADTKNFDEAGEACYRRDSWLVEVKTKEIDDALTELITQGNVWIGLSYSTNDWKWNDGSPLRYANWVAGSTSPSTKRCAKKSSSGQWDDGNCENNKAYVCQSDAKYPEGYLNAHNSLKNYNKASQACKIENQALVDVKRQELHNLILQKFGDTKKAYWTSGNDLNTSNYWFWGDGTPIDVSSKNWLQWSGNPEPNGNAEHCVAFVTSHDAHKGWADVKCSNANYYICQNKCGTGACLNNANCTVSNGRHKCHCVPGYFGNKCEKDLISISTDSLDIRLSKGEAVTLNVTVESYDGTVVVSMGKDIKEMAFTSEWGTRVVSFLLGPQVANATYNIKATTQSHTYTKSSEIAVKVFDRCDSNPCQNSGVCSYNTTPPYFTCDCTHKAFEGATCSERRFVSNGTCKFHVYYEKPKDFSHEAAKTICINEGGTLAMMKSAAIQDFVESVLIDQYGEDGDNIALWIGGHKPQQTWIWMDGTNIPITSGFQHWIRNYNRNGEVKMLMTSWQSTRDNLRWAGFPVRETRSAFVCEKSETTNPCESSNCKNGGVCVAVGCQMNCDCPAGYGGEKCETDLITIFATKTKFLVIQGQHVTVTLNIISEDGPVKIEVSKNSFEDIVDTKEVPQSGLVNITVGPLESQTPRDTYYFRATPVSEQGSYYRNTSVTIGVQGPPSIPDLPRSILAIPTGQDDTDITCNAIGFPTPNVTWKYEGTKISTVKSGVIYQIQESSKSTLRFTKNASSEVGYYTCYAESAVDGILETANASLFVIGKLQLIKAESNNSEFSHEAARLSCTFQSFPAPNITWIQDKSRDGVTEMVSSLNSVFSIETKLDRPSSLITKSSLLKIALPEYLGPTNIRCLAYNDYQNLSSPNFILNSKIERHRNLSYLLYIEKEEQTNFSQAESHCKSVNRTLLKIPNNETQLLVSNILTKNLVSWNVFIGGKRFIRDNNKLWLWPDDTMFYNESKHGMSSTSGAKIVDGNFVAWHFNEPNEVAKSCVRLDHAKHWSWIDTNCSKNLGYICVSAVAGIPTSFGLKVEECSANLTVTWSASKEAFGVNHRFNVKKLMNASKTTNLSENVIPETVDNRTISFNNLAFDTEYNVSIIVCPECPMPYTMSKFISTYELLPPENQSIFKANTTLSGRKCVISWRMNTSMKDIIGFRIKAHFTIAKYWSSEYTGKEENLEFNATKAERNLEIYPDPNRNYSFGVSVVTCLGTSPFVIAQGSCVSDTGPPAVIPPPTSKINEVGSITIQTSIPNERTGPISCIFVVMVYKPATSWNQTIFESMEALQQASSRSEKESLEPNDAYIAIAVGRHEINGEDGVITHVIGDGRSSECNVRVDSPSRRRKRETDDEVIVGLNRELEEDVEYRYFSATTTPGNDGIWVKASLSNPLKKPSTGNSGGLIGGIVGALIAICLAIAAFVIIRRRTNARTSKSNDVSLQELQDVQDHIYANLDGSNDTTETDTNISMNNLLEVYNSLKASDGLQFREEFEKIKKAAKKLDYRTEVASNQTLKRKNRYKNILPSDETRVVLDGSGESSYINACFIDGFSKVRKFIATQGPLPSTVADFWRMIVEQKTNVIAMLTKCKEKHKVKCEKYWPDHGQSKNFGGITVQNMEEASFGSFKVRKLKIVREDETFVVHHFHFLNWPDHGVPVTTTSILRYYEAVMEITATGPIVVHCSAGAGRTGAFIGYNYLLEEARSFSSVDVYRCVMKMRKQRTDMVQNCDQYILIHKLLLEQHLFGETDMASTEALNAVTNLSRIEQQFRNLSGVGPINETKHGDTEKNRHHNRNLNILPYELNKVTILMQSNESEIPYINASTIVTYESNMKIIAAQGPMKDSIEYFWRAVLDCNVNTIVMLTKCVEGNKEQCAQYWPEDGEQTVDLKDMIVKVKEYNKIGNVITRNIQVVRAEQEKTIIQHQYTTWNSNECPKNPNEILEVVEKMHSSVRRDKDGAALVHCSDGAGRTGTFCAIVNLLERLKSESRVDVFRTVKDLRDCRPQMVSNLDQYRFCYEAMTFYLNSFSLYSNFQMETKREEKEENIYQNL